LLALLPMLARRLSDGC